MQTTSENDREEVSSARHLESVEKLILLNNIRIQLIEQMHFLDAKIDSHSGLINDLIDFFQQRSESESNHSWGLEKIIGSFQTNNHELMTKNIQPYSCWQHLLVETQYLSQKHAALSELYKITVQHKLECILRTYKKYRELVSDMHEEILRILRNLYTIVNTYNNCQNQLKRANAKADFNDGQRKKTLQASRRDNPHSASQNQIHTKEYIENLKARNVYKHYMETFTAALHKTMLGDLKDISYSMDSGFSLMVSNAVLAHLTSDHAKFYKKLFCPYELLPSDKNTEINRQCFLESVKLRCDLSKTEDESQIKNLILFQFELQLQRLKRNEEALQKDLEKTYRIWDAIDINSIDGLTTTNNEIKSKLSSKSYHKASTEKRSTPNRPRLFGGSLEEYIRVTNEQIPLILKSCVRVITLFGLRSQGIFRVSGSQVEILNLRDAFERGEDPLADATDCSDINSVAGVLKLYLRKLEEPLFPAKYFDFFMSLIQMESTQDIIVGLRNFFKNFSKPVVIVIRYLFSFLHHLSDYANENMMDAFNLAISFGPTLMPAPEDKKQLQYQTQLNDLIKMLIIYNNQIFPMDLDGPQYNDIISDTK